MAYETERAVFSNRKRRRLTYFKPPTLLGPVLGSPKSKVGPTRSRSNRATCLFCTQHAKVHFQWFIKVLLNKKSFFISNILLIFILNFV